MHYHRIVLCITEAFVKFTDRFIAGEEDTVISDETDAKDPGTPGSDRNAKPFVCSFVRISPVKTAKGMKSPSMRKSKRQQKKDVGKIMNAETTEDMKKHSRDKNEKSDYDNKELDENQHTNDDTKVNSVYNTIENVIKQASQPKNVEFSNTVSVEQELHATDVEKNKETCIQDGQESGTDQTQMLRGVTKKMKMRQENRLSNQLCSSNNTCSETAEVINEIQVESVRRKTFPLKNKFSLKEREESAGDETSDVESEEEWFPSKQASKNHVRRKTFTVKKSSNAMVQGKPLKSFSKNTLRAANRVLVAEEVTFSEEDREKDLSSYDQDDKCLQRNSDMGMRESIVKDVKQLKPAIPPKPCDRLKALHHRSNSSGISKPSPRISIPHSKRLFSLTASSMIPNIRVDQGSGSEECNSEIPDITLEEPVFLDSSIDEDHSRHLNIQRNKTRITSSLADEAAKLADAIIEAKGTKNIEAASSKTVPSPLQADDTVYCSEDMELTTAINQTIIIPCNDSRTTSSVAAPSADTNSTLATEEDSLPEQQKSVNVNLDGETIKVTNLKKTFRSIGGTKGRDAEKKHKESTGLGNKGSKSSIPKLPSHRQRSVRKPASTRQSRSYALTRQTESEQSDKVTVVEPDNSIPNDRKVDKQTAPAKKLSRERNAEPMLVRKPPENCKRFMAPGTYCITDGMVCDPLLSNH